MKRLRIMPSSLKGRLSIPSSKSHTMRALIFASLAKGKSTIHSPLRSKDTQTMLKALRQLGVHIQEESDRFDVTGLDGCFKPARDVLDAENSGQVMRFLGAMAGLSPTYTILTGDDSVKYRRPLTPLLSALEQLGAWACSATLDGKAPLIIRGPMRAGFARMLGQDSQPVSAMLMATSFLEGNTQLQVDEPGETSWIELTLAWIRKLGGIVEHDNYHRYHIQGGLHYVGFETTIPGDFSSAAFPLIAALITRSKIALDNVDLNDVQGDKKIIEFLENMGASLKKESRSIYLESTNDLHGACIDIDACIDAVPILAVLGCFTSSKMELVNAKMARFKESDRLHAITYELRKMGAEIEEHEETLTIYPSRLRGTQLSAHHDHRIAMALVVAALAAEGVSSLDGLEWIQKSYPTFVTDLQQLGAQLEWITSS